MAFDEVSHFRSQAYDRRVDKALADKLGLVVREPYDVEARVAPLKRRLRDFYRLLSRTEYQHSLANAELRVARAPGH